MFFTTHGGDADPLGRAAAPARPKPPAVGAGWYGPCKVTADFVAALVLFVVALPIMVAVGLLVKLTSRGPVIYRQTRLGLDGRPYVLRKIRTMAHNCELHSGPRWSTGHDPRVTPLGRFLRKSHLDELPQLWNVLCGEMSLVGPRPERPEFVPTLERSIPRYRERLRVRPGITGLAQVWLPPDTDLNSVRRKLAYDLYYVRHLGPWLDLRLVVCTGLSLVGVPFHVGGRLLCLPGGDAVEDEAPAGPAAGATASSEEIHV
ncbi:MAG TPA: sugar transferase [Gemmataceae bacterium]|nr:sugar transferase [Gemmataceae bacterium]